jgi:large subunit ribosomal protein L6
MSRIGRKEIAIPQGVTVIEEGHFLKVTKGEVELTVPIHDKTRVSIEEGIVRVKRVADDRLSRSVHGLTRTLIANAIEGANSPFEKQLEIIGVGFRAAVEDGTLKLKLGFSHEINFPAPDGITFEVKKNIIKIIGADKQRVGQTAAEIRRLKKPEPYKGKGIKYVGEKIIRKVGKAVKSAGTGA